jgi:hypothetical protein
MAPRLDANAAGNLLYHRAMLPKGFYFETYKDGPALYVDGRMLADIVPLGDARFRACLNPLRFSIRYVLFDSEAAAKAYVTEWAWEWEDLLRETPYLA